MNIKSLFLLLSVLLFTACIPNKDLVYLQKENTNNSAIEVAPFESKPYRLQVGDMISIGLKASSKELVEMFQIAENANQGQNSPQGLYFNGYTVDSHGNIRIPVLEEINVLGYTIDEVRAKIEKQLLEEHLKKEARLFVNVKLAGLRYTINGEVGSTGTNVLYQDRATIMEAIANSGDITLTGNRKEVQIIRKYPHGFETHVIDLTSEKAQESPYFYIQNNDYIYVKPIKQKSWGTGTTGVQTFTTIFSAISLITTALLLSKNF